MICQAKNCHQKALYYPAIRMGSVGAALRRMSINETALCSECAKITRIEDDVSIPFCLLISNQFIHNVMKRYGLTVPQLCLFFVRIEDVRKVQKRGGDLPIFSCVDGELTEWKE